MIDHNGHLKLTDFGLSRIGFLDRRVRDELNTGSFGDRMQPHSPAPSRSGTPPQSPAEQPSTPNSNAYRHSYFSLLFNQESTPSGSNTASNAEDTSKVTPTEPRSENTHRRHLSAALSESLSNTSSMAKTTEKNAKGQVLKQAVGTPDYLAPESILGTGQDSMVDWVSDFFFFSLYSFSFFFLLLPVLLLSFHYYFITFFFLHIFFYC